MKFETLSLSETIQEEALIATYYLQSESEPDLYDWVKLVAADQSAGTWTHVEGETPEVIEKYGAKVIGIYPMVQERACVARIAFPLSNFPFYMPIILSTVAGNVLGQAGIRLLDIEFPPSVLAELSGPLLGIEGIRKQLGVWGRPLVGAILKPCIGVPPEVSASGAAKAAQGGVDVIKDDELLSDPAYSPMLKRLQAVMQCLRDIGKENSVLYAVNITGENVFDRARRAIDAGANAVMVNYQALGWGAVEDLVRRLKREKLSISIFGHCAGMGAYYRSHTNGISTALCLGKLPRLIGIDMALVYPDSGRFGIETNELVETHSALTSPLGNIKPAFTTVAGGIHPGTVETLINLLGHDTLLMAGGGIYGHPMGPTAGAIAIRQAIEAAMAGVSVKESAGSCAELAAALNYWGS